MVLEFYRLAEPPFGVTPDPQFLYLGKTHREALASVLHGLNAGRGFTALIAGAGMGKTVLLRLILQKLQTSTRTAFLSQTHCSPRELLIELLASLGIKDGGETFSAMHSKLNDILLRDFNAHKRFVLVIDEAQNLAEPTFELLRVLSNVETPREKLIHFILAGHPQLAEKLATPQLAQLRQRVSIIARLEPFDAEEARLYIDYRLRVAGYDFSRPLFTSPALDLITGHTRGIPRNINNVCFHALSLGFIKRLETIDVDVIQEVLEDLALQPVIEAGGEVPFASRSHFGDSDVLEVPMDPYGPGSDSRSLALGEEAPRSTNMVGETQGSCTEVATSVSSAGLSRSPRDADQRRSSRIKYPISLIILGTDPRGESFREKTAAISLNLHGCRYSSHHEYPLGGWVTLQVGGEGAQSASVRARVRSIFSSQSPLDSDQIGVELETPNNVWGVPEPPEDWRAAVAPFPPEGPRVRKQSVGSETESSVSARVVRTLEQFLPAFQDKLQQTADRVAQTAVESRLAQSLQDVLARIDEFWQANSRQTEEFSIARLAEIRVRLEEELDAHRSRAEETSKRLEVLGTKAGQGLLELQKFVTRVKSDMEPQYDACLNRSLLRAASELDTIAAHVSERHRAELDRVGQAALCDARSQLGEAFSEMRALQDAKPPGVPEEKLESLIGSSRESILKYLEERLGGVYGQLDQQQQLARHHATEFSEQLETLAASLRESQAQHDESVAQMRSLLASRETGLSPELFDSRMVAERERIFKNLEGQLSEFSARSDQRHDRIERRIGEMAQQLESVAHGFQVTQAQHDESIAEIRSLLASRETGLSPELFDTRMVVEREWIFKNLEGQLSELSARSDRQRDGTEQRAVEMAQRIEALAVEMGSVGAQHERSIADLSARFDEVSRNSSQERLDGALRNAGEQLSNSFQSRIVEFASGSDQRHESLRLQFDELAGRLQEFANDTRTQLLETRELAERVPRELLPQNLSNIEESTARALQEIENSAVRVSDRQLLRMMDHKEAVARELSLDLETRASETRALVERAANSTLEDFQRRLERLNELTIAEAIQRVTSTIASLDAEYRSSREVHHQTLNTEVARAAEQSMTEFRSSMKAFLYSCLVAAVSAVDQHAQGTLGGLPNDQNNSTLRLDAISDSPGEYLRPSSAGDSSLQKS